jgi:hypothetical protein
MSRRPDCQRCQQSERQEGGLGGRATLYHVEPVNTGHAIAPFQSIPTHYDASAIIASRRSAIPHPVVLRADHVMRLISRPIIASIVTRPIIAFVVTSRLSRICCRVPGHGLRLSYREC